MSYSSRPTSLPLNVMINKDKTKVLFAEANIDFTNVLLSFLALPLRKVDESFISLGSLSTLHSSLHKMDESYFSARCSKELLLNPQTPFRAECRKLAIDVTDSLPRKIFVCSDKECREIGYKNVSAYSDIAKCYCGKWLNREILVVESLDGRSFVTNPSSFIITDELRVVPVLGGVFETLSNLGITDTQGAEFMSFTFDISQMRKLFTICLSSATPLTDMIIKKSAVPKSIPAKPELGISLHHFPKGVAHSSEMVLKIFMQKSTNKFLYAEATYVFLEMLVSFLTLPVGGLEFLLGAKTGFRGIDSLYQSVSRDIPEECFTTPETKTRLIIKPELSYLHFSYNYFLPLGKEYKPPKLCYETVYREDPVIKNTTFRETNTDRVIHFKSGDGLIISVKNHTKCIVADDLTVNPSLTSTILMLNKLGIPLSDVKETELRIGLEEALRILMVSLTSKTVLTDALIQPMLNKSQEVETKIKQEP